ALDVRPGVLQHLQRLRVAAEDDPDLLEDRVGVVLDEAAALLVEDLERLQRAGQERRARGVRRRLPRPDSRVASAARATASLSGRFDCGVGHRPPPIGWDTPRRRFGGRVADGRRPFSLDSPPTALRAAGSSTSWARFVAGAVACGIAMASTKCSWKRGSTAVSIFSTVRTTRSISWQASPESSAMSAPVPAALPAAPTRSSGASGTSPSTRACSGSIWLPNAPAS